MPGWMYYGNTNGFDIWENDHYIPMGFTYDSYVTEKDYENTSESYRELLMLKGIVLTDKQVSKWGDMLSPLDTSELSYTKETYKTDCENRAKLTCNTFEYTNTGFNATITASRDVPVFFSIPYENGWSAYVNGEKVDIEKVNVGFMAIRVNAGTNVKIEFKYRTPACSSAWQSPSCACFCSHFIWYSCARSSKKSPCRSPATIWCCARSPTMQKSTARILKTAGSFT